MLAQQTPEGAPPRSWCAAGAGPAAVTKPATSPCPWLANANSQNGRNETNPSATNASATTSNRGTPSVDLEARRRAISPVGSRITDMIYVSIQRQAMRDLTYINSTPVRRAAAGRMEPPLRQVLAPLVSSSRRTAPRQQHFFICCSSFSTAASSVAARRRGRRNSAARSASAKKEIAAMFQRSATRP